MSTDYKFEGWLGKSPEAANGKMEYGEFQPKKWEETDVDIKIEFSGICGVSSTLLRIADSCVNLPTV